MTNREMIEEYLQALSGLEKRHEAFREISAADYADVEFFVHVCDHDFALAKSPFLCRCFIRIIFYHIRVTFTSLLQQFCDIFLTFN